MCGLTGFIDYTGNSSPAILNGMSQCIEHRGPDDSGAEFLNVDGAQVGFGFRRLSIIDLSPSGHQPMINTRNGDMLLFNGEIYNYREIRRHLEKLGCEFTSQSDSEVILKSFEKWGPGCVSKFIGMFAIAIYSPASKKVFFYRDRAGVKPFFYFWNGSGFIFASELKSIHLHPAFKKEINFDALALFFHHGYIPAPYTIFKNTFKIIPGHMLEFDLASKNFTDSTYWNIIDYFNKPRLNISFEEASMQLETMLTDAFHYRMIADVPVGVFLSGGYDSSCVTALIQKHSGEQLKTYTIGFEHEAFNEAHYAKKVAEYIGTDHHEFLCSDKEAMDIIPMLPDIYDEPIADGGAIPNILVSKMASRQVKVVLSADGGDEVFAGYTKYQHAIEQVNRYKSIPGFAKTLMASVSSMAAILNPALLYEINRAERFSSLLGAANSTELFDHVNRFFSNSEIKSFFKNSFNTLKTRFDDDHLFNTNNDDLSKIIAVDYQTYLPDDILAKVDRATSSVSIEGREPLLDHRIAEFAAQLPSSYKLNNGKGKFILRDVVHRYVPKEIMDRPKMGFGLPLSIWGMKELKPLFEELFDRDFLTRQNIFNVSRIRELYDHYMAGNPQDFDKLWMLFIFQQWYKKWMQ